MRLFEKMIILSCYLMPRYYREELNQEYVTKHFPDVASSEFTEKVDEMCEAFLDDVYGDNSSLEREKFLRIIITRTNWIFKIELVRTRFAKLCECESSDEEEKAQYRAGEEEE